MTMTGAKRAADRLLRLSERAEREFGKANRENGEEIVRYAKLLVPKGKTRKALASIHGAPEGEASFLIDFGPLSKILEGGRKAGVSEKGRPYPAMAPRPFVNPALTVTEKKRRARNRRAVRNAAKG